MCSFKLDSILVLFQNYLTQLLPSVFGQLREGGFFYDLQEREVESQFLPWLMDAVEQKLSRTEIAHKILDGMLAWLEGVSHRGGCLL